MILPSFPQHKGGATHRFGPAQSALRKIDSREPQTGPRLAADGISIITLTSGLVAFVDAADHAWLSQWNWHAHRNPLMIYAARNASASEPGPALIYMHRAILEPRDGLLVDHANGHTLDNRRANLREATHVDNGSNRRVRPAGLYRGVTFDERRGKHAAYFTFNRQKIWLGYFIDPADAARAYDAAIVKYRGEFAVLNFPEAT